MPVMPTLCPYCGFLSKQGITTSVYLLTRLLEYGLARVLVQIEAEAFRYVLELVATKKASAFSTARLTCRLPPLDSSYFRQGGEA